MKISDDTQRVIEILDAYSDKSLRKRSDLALILEIGATFNLPDEIADIIFTGKILWNLGGYIGKLEMMTIPPKFAKEISGNMADLREKLTAHIEIGEEADRKRFHDIYLTPNAGTDRNLMDLAHDLAELKDLQIKSKAYNKGGAKTND